MQFVRAVRLFREQPLRNSIQRCPCSNTDRLPVVKTPLSSRVWNHKDAQIRNKIEELHPFKGLGTAEDVAPVAVFLASEDARWVSGTSVAVDGGYTCQ